MVLELFGLTLIKTAAVGIEIANVGLLSGLLYLYIKSYRQIKIGFTIGLILFALVLLIRSILAITLLIMASDMLTGRQALVGGFIEFIALAILLKITWDY